MAMGLIKTSLAIAFFIFLVQLMTIYHYFTKYNSTLEERSRKNVHSYEDVRIEDDKDIFPENYKDKLKTLYSTEAPDEEEETTVTETCTLKHKDALSALKRAKTEKCQREIEKVACAGEAHTLYWTNITRLCPVDRAKGRPSHGIIPKAEFGPPIRILYAMVVHGRAFRQVKRLFKALFHSNHYFYFHVDSRSDYLHSEVQKLAARFTNVAVAPWRMATIWGGASLVKMLLQMMEDVLRIRSWKWDFFINLSASDYPVQTDEKLSAFLRAHRDENFLKPHGGTVERFVRKQGISRTFLECEERMWRLGERKLPETIDFDGGSDWIALNKKFVSYVVFSEDTLVQGLKHLYSYALLPAESFFHSVLRNSPHCESYAKGNLRLTNWKRKLGCRCQYKHIVDWCGCSPNDFKVEDFVRLKSQTINHFARKFEPIINQEIINLLDQWLYGELPPEITPGLHSYWESLYMEKMDVIEKIDIPMTFYQSLARITVDSLTQNNSEECRFTQVWKAKEATLYTVNDLLQGVLVVFYAKVATDDIKRDFVTLETFFSVKPMMFMHNRNMSEPNNRLQSLTIGTHWDQKERIFRNIAGFIGPNDSPTLVHRWVHGTEFHVRIVWQDPLNVIAGMYQMKVEKNWVISFHKPTFNKPLRPGTWVVKIVYNDDTVLGEVRFLVVPQAFVDARAISLEEVVASNNGPPAGLYSSDFVVEFDRDATDTVVRVKDFSDHSSSVGAALDAWIDRNVAQHWKHTDTCALNQPNVPARCLPVPLKACADSPWSSRSPDLKSEIGNVNKYGRLR